MSDTEHRPPMNGASNEEKARIMERCEYDKLMRSGSGVGPSPVRNIPPELRKMLGTEGASKEFQEKLQSYGRKLSSDAKSAHMEEAR